MTEMNGDEAAVVARFEAGEPAPESWGGGLREAIAEALEYTDGWTGARRADAVLALPEIAALRAKAAAADLLAARVLRLADEMDRAGSSPVNWYVDRLRRTLNGLPC